MQVLRRASEFLVESACFALLFLLLFNPEASLEALKESAIYAISTVSVAIFPYMIMASLLSTGRSSALLGLPLVPITRYLMKVTSKKAAAVLAVALIGGFAAAGVVTSRLHNSKVLTDAEAGRLIAASYIPSVPFMVLIVGKSTFQSYELGVYIALAVVTASIITASLLSVGAKVEDHNHNSYEAAIDIGTHINKAINGATLNTLYICGLICFFGMISKMLYVFLDTEISIIVSGVIEFSTALRYTADNGIYFATFFLALLGICSYFQVSVIAGKVASAKTFIISRAISAPLSVVFLKLLFWVRPIDTAALSSMGKIYIMPYQYNMEMSILVFLMIIISLTDFISKKGLH